MAALIITYNLFDIEKRIASDNQLLLILSIFCKIKTFFFQPNFCLFCLVSGLRVDYDTKVSSSFGKIHFL